MNPEEFKEKFGFVKPKQNQEIVFYCRSGKRSASACDIAKRNGFTKWAPQTLCSCHLTDYLSSILNYKGSWLEWVEKEGIKS